MKIKLISILFTFFCKAVFAQDIHFSQFCYSPLSLNPALTGDINGNIRGVLNHRNQWNTISIPYITSSLSFDTRLFENKFNGNTLGTGIIAVTDKAGEGAFSNFQVMLGTSFHKIFGREKLQVIAVGIQSGFIQKRVDVSGLTFPNQFQYEDFDASLPSGENYSENSITRFDISAGAVCKLQLQSGGKMNGGLSFFHINRPVESLLGGYDRISLRSVVHYMAKFPVNAQLNFSGEFLFMTQNRAREMNIGGKFEINLLSEKKKRVDLLLGAGYRRSDALIFCAGVKYDKLEYIISYDVNVSRLHTASNYNGAFEISLVYTDIWFSTYNRLQKTVPCLRM